MALASRQAVPERDGAAADGAGRDRRPVHIYVIGEQSGPRKIGKALNLEARLRALTAQTGRPLEVLGFIMVEAHHAFACEQATHERLKAHRVRGEWFDVTDEEALSAIDASADAVCSARLPVLMAPSEFRAARLELGLSAAKMAAALELGGDGGRTVRRWEQEPGTAGHRPVAGPAAVAVRLMLAMARAENERRA